MTIAAVTHRPAPRVTPQIAYGTGQVAGQIFRDLPSLLLLFFMTNALGIEPALAGSAIFVPKFVWGIACDFSVGVVSDRIGATLARRWWLLFGAVGAPPVLILLFHVPVLSEFGRALYVAASFSAYMLIFAIFSVPYLAIAGELADNPRRRTHIMAWRLVFTAVGVLVADSFAPIFIQAHGGGQEAYEKMAVILAAVCTASLIVAFFGAGAAASRAGASGGTGVAEKIDAGQAVRALLEPRFSVLLGANFCLLAGGGMAYASMLYFFTYNLHRSDALQQAGLVTFIACATIIGSQPGWVHLAHRFGKKPTYVAAALFYGAVAAGWGLLGPIGLGVSYGFAVLLGISNSGWTLMGYSMMSDIASAGRAGLYSSAWIAADKIGFALGGTLLVGMALSRFGFDAARAVAGLPQPASALHGVLLAFGIAPALLSVLAAAIFAVWGHTTETA